MQNSKKHNKKRMGLQIACLLLVTTLLSPLHAQEFVLPPPASTAILQTNGPDAELQDGDWWTNAAIHNSDQRAHIFEIYVPRLVREDFEIELELYDPECLKTGEEADEQGGDSWDSTSFTLIAPNEISVVKEVIFRPTAETSEKWTLFAEFTAGDYGVGVYRLEVTTARDDKNSYALRIREHNPDGRDNSGDEITIAAQNAMYRHSDNGCVNFWFYSGQQSPLSLLNFDMDNETSLHYTDPYGGRYLGLLSGNALWNNDKVTFSETDGDQFIDPISGWWKASACVAQNNPYIFYPHRPLFIDEKPDVPRLFVQVSDGMNRLSLYDEPTYTITISNAGSGPALHITVTDTIPAGTNYSDASGFHNQIINSQQNYVEWFIDILRPGESTSLDITLQVHDETVSQIINSVLLKYSDIMFNDYYAYSNKDINQMGQCSNIGASVWADQNGNGLYDDGELGLPGIIIQLLDNDGNVVESTVTDETGHYYFYCVDPGQYAISMDNKSIPLGFVLSTHSLPMRIDLQPNSVYDSANFGFSGSHYPVELSSFTATHLDNTIRINWTTQSETENYGYHIYRSEEKDREYVQVTTHLIAGAGNSNSENTYAFIDETIETGKTYYYKLADISTTGNKTWHGPVSVQTAIADQYMLEPNYPNPFNPQTTISFTLKQSGYTTLEIFNIRGQKLSTLVSEHMPAGTHKVIWDGRDQSGRMMPSGTYLYRLQVNDFQKMRKMMLIK